MTRPVPLVAVSSRATSSSPLPGAGPVGRPRRERVAQVIAAGDLRHIASVPAPAKALVAFALGLFACGSVDDGRRAEGGAGGLAGAASGSAGSGPGGSAIGTG